MSRRRRKRPRGGAPDAAAGGERGDHAPALADATAGGTGTGRPEPPGREAPDAAPAAAAARRRQPFAARLRAKLIQTAVFLLFALAAFVTGLLVFNYLLMPGLIHSRAEVRVPDVERLALDQAEAVLAQAGLQISRAGERFNPEVPRGFVISQDPQPGAPVRRVKTVQVVLSLGEEFSSVPALFGESRRSAEQLLQSAGLTLGRVTRASSGEVGEGLVLATDPPAETVLPRGGPVSLLISSGTGEDAFLMPDLMGREIGRARAQLEAFGLRVRVPAVSAPVGAVVWQQPRPGAQITRRDTVTLQAVGRLIR